MTLAICKEEDMKSIEIKILRDCRLPHGPKARAGMSLILKKSIVEKMEEETFSYINREILNPDKEEVKEAKRSKKKGSK